MPHHESLVHSPRVNRLLPQDNRQGIRQVSPHLSHLRNLHRNQLVSLVESQQHSHLVLRRNHQDSPHLLRQHRQVSLRAVLLDRQESQHRSRLVHQRVNLLCSRLSLLVNHLVRHP